MSNSEQMFRGFGARLKCGNLAPRPELEYLRFREYLRHSYCIKKNTIFNTQKEEINLYKNV